MTKFPNTPSFTGTNKPERWEADIVDLEVEGEIPARDQRRVLPRAAGSAVPAAPGRRHRLQRRRPDHRCSTSRTASSTSSQRWVQTDKWKLEHEAGKALFGAYRNPLTDDPSVKGRYRGTANTNVLTYRRQAVALKEDSPPVVMDPVTMETIGYENFGGTLTGADLHRPSQDRSRNRQDDRVLLRRREALLTRRHGLFRHRPRGQGDPRGVVRGALLLHDARFRRSRRITSSSTSSRSSAAWDRLEKGMPHFGFDTTHAEIYLGVSCRAMAKPRTCAGSSAPTASPPT